MRISDWSSDVCSSDLIAYLGKGLRAALAVLVLLAFYAPSFSNGSGAFIGIIVTLPATVVWYMLGDPYGIDNAYVALACPVIVMGLFHLTSRRTAPIVTGTDPYPNSRLWRTPNESKPGCRASPSERRGWPSGIT